MRIATTIHIAALSGLLGATAPVSAKKPEAGKTSEQRQTTSSSACHAYEPAANGSWTEIPCEEVGGQTQHKVAPKTGEQEPR